ncbi:DUF1093 domain-containing protein [Vagococcus vulneris]|uniref:Uncharacterized protein n=1 Tax=Vagococcus vulneris TaxID=1977869 RepID=A0A429ZXP9_9ENTE|nr:DUF1093 domain-containing protein [Vagococcus vulneris]RST98536.1 hypothetical protein CBF37_07105 [Vagococcus vulneris]
MKILNWVIWGIISIIGMAFIGKIYYDNLYGVMYYTKITSEPISEQHITEGGGTGLTEYTYKQVGYNKNSEKRTSQ